MSLPLFHPLPLCNLHILSFCAPFVYQTPSFLVWKAPDQTLNAIQSLGNLTCKEILDDGASNPMCKI